MVAVMSVLLAKVFCDLALASDEVAPAPSLNSPAVVLGSYRVKDITGDDGRSKCSGARPESECGKIAWLMRSAEQVALIEAQNDANPSALFTFLMHPTLFNRKCDGFVNMEEARAGLFNSK